MLRTRYARPCEVVRTLGWLVLAIAATVAPCGCVGAPSGPHATRAPLGPDVRAIRPPGPSRLGVTDVTKENTPVRGFASAGVIDTRTIPQRPDDLFPGVGALVENRLPDGDDEEMEERAYVRGAPNDLVAGKTLDEGRTNVTNVFPAITATGWVPPDPTLAVGPNHVVVTVNSKVAFYTKAGPRRSASPWTARAAPGSSSRSGRGASCSTPSASTTTSRSDS